MTELQREVSRDTVADRRHCGDRRHKSEGKIVTSRTVHYRYDNVAGEGFLPPFNSISFSESISVCLVMSENRSQGRL